MCLAFRIFVQNSFFLNKENWQCNDDIILIRRGFIFFTRLHILNKAVHNYLEITSQYCAFSIVLRGSVSFVSQVLNLVPLYLVHPCATWHFSSYQIPPKSYMRIECLVCYAPAACRMHADRIPWSSDPCCMAAARLRLTWGPYASRYSVTLTLGS